MGEWWVVPDSNRHRAVAQQALSAGPNTLGPGSRLTTAEVTGDVGLASLQRLPANLPEFSSERAQRRMNNNAVRVAFVENQFS